MNITEVRIKLMDEPGDRLKAFCSITFDDCFVIRDLKIIEGTTGPFVAMPSRKLTAHCPKCGMKNHLRANFCNQCGSRLEEGRAIKDADGRTKLYADIAHPINSRCREAIQDRVVDEYESELERAKSPDYVSRYDDYDGGDFCESDVVVTRRVDEPHRANASNRPHHPPEGDPVESSSNGGPHRSPSRKTKAQSSKSIPTSTNQNTSNPSQSEESSSGPDQSFGAGIF